MQTPRLAVQAGRLTGAVFVPLLLMTSAHLARAQTSATTTREGWVVGALVGRMQVGGWADGHATAIGVAGTRFIPQRPSLDFAVVTIPRLFRAGEIPLHARMGMALPLGPKVGPFLVPTVGLDVAGVAGESDGGWVGYHWGARALFPTRKLGVEAGVVWVRAFGARNALWLAELGLMRVPLPGPPRPRAATPVPNDI